MTRAWLAAVLLSAPSASFAEDAAAPAAPAVAAPRAPEGGSMVSLSLVEALASIERPELAGLFSFIPPQNASYAFGDLMARDPKGLKRYAAKLKGDLKAAGGLTEWDHEVCATLVNIFAGQGVMIQEKPSKKVMAVVNDCVLSPVLDLREIVARRKK